MEKLYDTIQKKKKTFWLITLTYIAFNGCFLFPSINHMIKTGTIDYPFSFVIVMGQIMIAVLFIGLIKAGPHKVFLYTLLFSVLGLCCRYLLEFGEVSNTVNFTATNVLVFLTGIPLFVLLAYFIIPQVKLDK